MAKFSNPDTAASKPASKGKGKKSDASVVPAAEAQAAEPTTSAERFTQPEAPAAEAPAAEAPAAEKAKRPVRATADACKALRGELNPRAAWKPTLKDPIATCRPGLRQNLMIAIRSAECAVEACGLTVTGGKYTTEAPYKVRMTDVGFALANGYVELVPTAE